MWHKDYTASFTRMIKNDKVFCVIDTGGGGGLEVIILFYI